MWATMTLYASAVSSLWGPDVYRACKCTRLARVATHKHTRGLAAPDSRLQYFTSSVMVVWGLLRHPPSCGLQLDTARTLAPQSPHSRERVWHSTHQLAHGLAFLDLWLCPSTAKRRQRWFTDSPSSAADRRQTHPRAIAQLDRRGLVGLSSRRFRRSSSQRRALPSQWFGRARCFRCHLGPCSSGRRATTRRMSRM